MRFHVQYSPDNGTTWETIDQNLTGTSADIDLSNLTRSDQALLRVVATDGIHSVSSAPSAPFKIPNRPPTVRIIDPPRPPSGPVMHVTDTPLSLCAAVNDPDGPIADGQIEWSSNADGVLGHGRCVTAATLSKRLHIITVTVDDGAGGTASDQISVQVVCFTKCTASGCQDCTPAPDGLSVAH